LAVAEAGVELGVSRIAQTEMDGSSPITADSGLVGVSDHKWAYTIGTDASGQYVEGSGTVDGLTRKTKIYGVARGYWSRYAYFANYYNLPDSYGNPGTEIWFVTGDNISGPVHCNYNIYISGQPIFYGPVTYVNKILTSNWNGTPNPQYMGGSPQRVPEVKMNSINFGQLKANTITRNGYVFTGDTELKLWVDQETSNTIMTAIHYDKDTGQRVTNDYSIGKSENNMVYVETGNVPDPGAGIWQTVEVIATNQVWEFSDPILSTNTDGYWTYSTIIGAGWQNTWCEVGNREYKWGPGPQHCRVGGSYWLNPVNWEYRVTTISNANETIETTTNIWAIRVNESSWHNGADDCTDWQIVWKGPTCIATWHAAGEIVTNGYGTSNLVEVVGTESMQIWIQDTNATLNKIGNVSVEGTISQGITIIADRDIRLTHDFCYTNEYDTGYAYTNTASDVMAALISGGDVVVQDNGVEADGQFVVNASIMATGLQTGAAEGDSLGIDGRFYVENYAAGALRGELTVYGGIIQNWRGAVGTGGSSGGTGFLKDYYYDRRYGDAIGKAPPGCPMFDVSFTFDKWTEW
ncbi:MAG: hypothetical protein JXN60_00135, partial [Lentisphaerae bacterium]|nr:hypothetical protein [Lentisphaerota bacterium]